MRTDGRYIIAECGTADDYYDISEIILAYQLFIAQQTPALAVHFIMRMKKYMIPMMHQLFDAF